MRTLKQATTAIPRRFQTLITTLTAYVFLLTGCARSSPISRAPGTIPPSIKPGVSFQPHFEPGECRFQVPALREIECGELWVRENRALEESPLIRLHVAILRSEAENPAPDPLIYLSGGPGSFALDWLVYDAEDYHDVLKQRDVIVFDQRGIGYSEPSLDCPEVNEAFRKTLDQDLSEEDLIQSKLAAHLACHDRLIQEGIDLTAYNSAASAADVNDLRMTLGYEHVNLLGLSYGTRLAQTVMRDFPEIVRSAVFDSPVPIQMDLLAAQGPHFEAALESVFARCAMDEDCKEAFPDIEKDLDILIEKLDEAPMTVRVKHLITFQQSEMLVNGSIFTTGVLFSLYDPDTIRELPKVIHHISHDMPMRDYLLSAFMEVYLLFYDYSSEGARYATLCSEELAFSSFDEALAQSAEMSRHLKDYVEQDLATDFGICKAWRVVEPDVKESQPLSSDVPSLVLTGEFDPITPYAWGRALVEGLAQATHVHIPNVSHGVYSDSRCARDIVADFLDDPAVTPDLSCVETLEQSSFIFMTE